MTRFESQTRALMEQRAEHTGRVPIPGLLARGSSLLRASLLFGRLFVEMSKNGLRRSGRPAKTLMS